MGSGGHNIKSKEEHKAKGNFRPGRHEGRIDASVKVVDTPPDPPKHFDKRHADLWRTCCKQAFELGILVAPDVYLIEAFVCHWFIWQDAIKDVQEQGIIITVETEKGVRQIKNPATIVVQENAKIIQQLADKFGFSPKSRMGIKTQEKPPEDAGAQFLN